MKLALVICVAGKQSACSPLGQPFATRDNHKPLLTNPISHQYRTSDFGSNQSPLCAFRWGSPDSSATYPEDSNRAFKDAGYFLARPMELSER